MTNRMEWQPIETAPKDGTIVDLYHVEFGRRADCYWGFPQHCCGEAGQYCDSDWHCMEEGWVCGILNDPLDDDDYTHWMPLPEPPLVDHPRTTTPVVDHEGGESDPQATRISELEAEVERLKGAIDRIFVMAEEFTTRPLESGESLLIRLSGIKWIAIRARSTAMNKGGE